jgi:hypothetical protein
MAAAANDPAWQSGAGSSVPRSSGRNAVTRLSPFGRNHHINLLGRYSFLLAGDLAGGLRPLRDPDAVDSDEEDEEHPA